MFISKNKGTFISFEGIDGCGKSTQVELLLKRLKKEEIDCIFVREPGGTDISEKIRKILLSNKNNNLSSRTEALLMTASRAQLTKETILPALEDGKCVIADRFKDSTLAYQGAGRGINMDYLYDLNNFATNNIEPQLTILLDIDPNNSFTRSYQEDNDRIENAGLIFQTKVRKGYLELADKYPNRIYKIDASQRIELIHSTIWEKTINCINVEN